METEVTMSQQECISYQVNDDLAVSYGAMKLKKQVEADQEAAAIGFIHYGIFGYQ